MADKDFRFSRENFTASEGDPSTLEDPQQLVERLLLTDPATDGDPRLTDGRVQWGDRWVEAYLEYYDEQTAWSPAAETRTQSAEPWVQAYLTHYGEETVWPRVAERYTARSERWVQEYLAYDGQETNWQQAPEQHTRPGERWVREYLAYYDEDTGTPRRSDPLSLPKAAGHG